MPLKLCASGVASPYFYIRGTHRGVSVRKTTGTSDRAQAEIELAMAIEAIDSGGLARDPWRPVTVDILAKALHEAAIHYDKRLSAGLKSELFFRLARVAIDRLKDRPIADGIWRSVPGFDKYEASDNGEIRRAADPQGRHIARVLRPKRVPTGHLVVTLYRDDGTQYRTGAHRIVCLTFNGPPPFPEAVARHLNGIADDNRPSNLAWGSHLDNADDARRHRAERTEKRKLSANSEVGISLAALKWAQKSKMLQRLARNANAA